MTPTEKLQALGLIKYAYEQKEINPYIAALLGGINPLGDAGIYAGVKADSLGEGLKSYLESQFGRTAGLGAGSVSGALLGRLIGGKGSIDRIMMGLGVGGMAGNIVGGALGGASHAKRYNKRLHDESFRGRAGALLETIKEKVGV